MKLVIFTDLHANLPALQAFVKRISSEGYDLLIHLGDAVAIGPYPRECLELLLELENIQLIMGNHDDWYVHGLPQPRPAWMTDGELAHQYWTHAQLGVEFERVIQSWPWIIRHQIAGLELSFMHYALGEGGRSFKGFLKNPTPDGYDRLFDLQADYVFYGHIHISSDLRGRGRYITPGSLGCQKTAVAPYISVEVIDGQLDVQFKNVHYDDRPLFEAFESRQVPEREFIYKAFFGGRFR